MPCARIRGLLIALALLAAGNLAEAAGRVVTFRGDNGRTVAGLLIEASERPAPAVVLVPMLGRPKDDWQAIGQKLADAGITALAIDLPSAAAPEEPKELSTWQEDVRAAIGFLSERSDVRTGSIGVAGASLGANLTALAAASEPVVRSIALVSPSLDYRGLRIEAALKQYGSRPALLVASLHDPYAARTVRELVKDAPGVRDARWSDTAAHGTVLLARDPAVSAALVEWFVRSLG